MLEYTLNIQEYNSTSNFMRTTQNVINKKKHKRNRPDIRVIGYVDYFHNHILDTRVCIVLHMCIHYECSYKYFFGPRHKARAGVQASGRCVPFWKLHNGAPTVITSRRLWNSIIRLDLFRSKKTTSAAPLSRTLPIEILLSICIQLAGHKKMHL